MFGSRMWLGVLDWLDDNQWLRRQMVRREAARERIAAALGPDALGELTWEGLAGELCRRGEVAQVGGLALDDGSLSGLTPDEIAARFETGELIAAGNQMLDVPAGGRGAALPGMDDDDLAAMRLRLTELLHGSDDPHEVMARLTDDGVAPSPACASVALCMAQPDRFGVWHESRVAGARRLAWLLGTEARWAGRYADYRSFNDLLVEIRDGSRGRLPDLMAVDAMLGRLAEVRAPRCWKVAIALSESDANADAVADRCLRRGHAALDGSLDGQDAVIARMGEIALGDYVVMHLRGRIGAVGRVVRPYYRFEADTAGDPELDWRHRVDVDWLVGDRSYGALLAGAQQRFTLVELHERVFWQIAEMYEDDPDYARVLRPRRPAWVFNCDRDTWRELRSVDKPLPLRDNWRLARGGEAIRVGDTVFIRRVGDDAAICGVAKVLSEPSGSGGAASVDLLHEVALDAPLPDERLAADKRTESCGLFTDPGAEVVQLSGAETAAVREMLDLPEDSYFVLTIDAHAPPALRSRTTYRYNHEATGRPEELTDAALWGRANCVVYHGAPDYTFVAFGPVVQVREEPGDAASPPDFAITTALQRFNGALRVRSLLGNAWRRRISEGPKAAGGMQTQTVLPVHPRDYYRVIAAGLVVTRKARSHPGIDALAEACCVPGDIAREIERLLRERGQMIFYGPPGTGKTWFALHLADYLSDGDPARREVVQFHPAYAYEDFIEGIRPQSVQGPDGRYEISYPVVAGLFVSFCERARLDLSNTYVLVIDEINRAQLPKVFGELLLLLEYRGRRVSLAYARSADDPTQPVGHDESAGFSVPSNLLVIGTMNTADRSIALVDHALRRRFVFYSFYPDDDSFLRPLFRTWLDRYAPEMAWVADLLDLVNARLVEDVGRNLLIGPSYFMRADLDEARLREVWRFNIWPLLEEYFAGMTEALDDYDLERFIAQVRPAAADDHDLAAGGE
jgi:MoxR-like ATPase